MEISLLRLAEQHFRLQMTMREFALLCLALLCHALLPFGLLLTVVLHFEMHGIPLFLFRLLCAALQCLALHCFG